MLDDVQIEKVVQVLYQITHVDKFHQAMCIIYQIFIDIHMTNDYIGIL